ncbi:MAG TPA: DegQ family serine endoprotease [Ferrovibrio sp.]|uniref:DegQ family serine endoprotease n=1 Tax=Ferrovibrio sp. TaxID=1917215 RepID=UPI002B4ABFE2|nr:DegQ family serine endoprotease [Ferrovibrio sp.]HLT75756.1 DegQ family serine endoprotease [Ferrovibrio sp.]
MDGQRKFSRRRKAILAALLATTIFTGGGLYAVQAQIPAGQGSPQAIQPVAPLVQHPGFADLVERVKPAVVNISTTEKVDTSRRQMRDLPFPPGSPFEQFFRQFGERLERAPRNALGSGFIIDPEGYIVTNNHVVEGAGKIDVTLSDGSSHPATVKGRDPKTDIALLKIDAKKPLPHVVFGDSDATRIGDWVIAVGNPFGLGGSVSAGIVSARGRDLRAGPYDDFLQFDAPINPGNSGGPIFDSSGRVIGIATAIYTPSGGNVGIGFGVPSKLAMNVVAQLKESGSVERGWLGVHMQPMTGNLAKALGRKNDDGVIVSLVQDDSPAKAAGVEQGDVITGVNGKEIKEPRDLAIAIANLKAGEKAKLQIWRDGRERTLTVTIGKQPADQVADAGEADGGDEKVGMALAPLTPELRARLGIKGPAKGVVVADVTRGSKAAESGVREGDVIIRIGGDPVTTPDEVAEKIRIARQAKKEAVAMLVLRDGTTYYLALQLA